MGPPRGKGERVAEDTLVNTGRTQHPSYCGFQAVWAQPVSASPSPSE